jgi:hypothetical protein
MTRWLFVGGDVRIVQVNTGRQTIRLQHETKTSKQHG